MDKRINDTQQCAVAAYGIHVDFCKITKKKWKKKLMYICLMANESSKRRMRKVSVASEHLHSDKF